MFGWCRNINVTFASNRISGCVLFSFLFYILSAVLMITTGVDVKSYAIEVNIFLSKKYLLFLDLIIILGSVSLIVSFLGSSVPLRGNINLIKLCFSLLIIISITEFFTALYGNFLKIKNEQSLEKNMEHSMALYDNFTEVEMTWDYVQHEFHCCGVFNYTDWKTEDLPISCCALPPKAIDFNCTVNASSLYLEGCLDRFREDYSKRMLKFECIEIGSIAFQIIFAYVFIDILKDLRNDYEPL